MAPTATEIEVLKLVEKLDAGYPAPSSTDYVEQTAALFDITLPTADTVDYLASCVDDYRSALITDEQLAGYLVQLLGV